MFRDGQGWQGGFITTVVVFLAFSTVIRARGISSKEQTLSDERIVFQTEMGNLELALWPEVAPVSSAHIMKLAKLGAYDTVHFFRVDKGFVAQTADVVGGRLQPLDERQLVDGQKTVPLEVTPSVKHDRRGLLSMARHTDPNSGGSSFSIMLGPAPHLNMQYTVFGEVTAGIETLAKFEEVETKREGIFVMPKERITIHSTYVYTPGGAPAANRCEDELQDLRERYHAQAATLEAIRSTKLPGN